jgi:hypothetical protein
MTPFVNQLLLSIELNVNKNFGARRRRRFQFLTVAQIPSAASIDALQKSHRFGT